MPRTPAVARYRGRFAPSPSGPLHLGSIVAALGSYLQARVNGGEWLLRIENIDPPRELPGAADAIQRELVRLGLEWDGEVCFQAQRVAAYRAALAQLEAAGLVYACVCSRRDAGLGPYPGTCRGRARAPSAPASLRLRVGPAPVTIQDRLQGGYSQILAQACGDFVVWRADNWPAYHLAVVVDDAWAGVTEIVRGADLLDSSPRQRYLQQCLGLPAPRYCHLPLVLDLDGSKLSKLALAAPVAGNSASMVLAQALRFLGHPPPTDALGAAPSALLAWAISAWSLAQVPLQSRRPEG
ncbi:MAG: tRNA glutamyl-Q(34) synthetase GluQRS [Gammaproteobacteria bacterium]|nr:tRNA glutamyl-Q(34) synthetase GluQRS [Gammaproteobacteria bacterium]